tara:strand:+ start:113 stop:331 length:219 start_codon:yes stop_codon:yes gene_type:complete
MTIINLESTKRLRESTKPESLAEKDYTIEGLEDFKSIMDFEEESDTIAVISHPGWKSHHKNTNKKYRDLRKY